MPGFGHGHVGTQANTKLDGGLCVTLHQTESLVNATLMLP